MNTPTNHKQLKKQEAEIFVCLLLFVGVFIFLPLVLRVVHGL
jgi:hypothetical protein